MIVATVEHPGGAYDVLAGPIEDSFVRIDKIARGKLVPVVSDAHVYELHGHRVSEISRIPPFLVPRGEEAKKWEVLRDLIENFARSNLDRHTPIIALGGGSIGDLTGLACSLYMRGSPVIHIPTTLLAQADSAIGGKTAIDAAGTKNLVGTFHHPALVVVDTSLLDTLDARSVRSGYAEVVKYGLIDDPQFFEWCESQGRALIAGGREARDFAIRHCIATKARFVGEDPDDRRGRRALLNLGHTFAHAIEAAAGLGKCHHGEAVSVGLTLAHALSVEAGLCARSDFERVAFHLKSVGLPISPEDVGLKGDKLIEPMGRDKKHDNGRLALILSRGIGKAFLDREFNRDTLASFLARAA